MNIEGVVAKEKESIYLPGKRVDTWLKTKNFKKESFFIYGYVKNIVCY
jgi:ATP-dependent DNA ligase